VLTHRFQQGAIDRLQRRALLRRRRIWNAFVSPLMMMKSSDDQRRHDPLSPGDGAGSLANAPHMPLLTSSNVPRPAVDGTQAGSNVLAQSWPLLLVAVGAPILFYVARGAAGGFFAADDFHFLTTARDRSWEHIFAIGDGARFYRPVVHLWFAGAVSACGQTTSCFHLLHLAAHALAGALLFALVNYTSRNRLLSFLTTFVFMVSPGYAEAVLWVSCATEVLSGVFLLATVLLCLIAADTRRLRTWILAAGAALSAVFSHEAGTAVFLLVPAFLWLTGRQPAIRVGNLWPFGVVALLFASALVLANWRNPLLTEGDYRLGLHMLRNGLDYLVSLYIGPHSATGYITMALAVTAVAVAGPPSARLGAAWMILSMLPFLGFVSGTTSRYLYTPTMGFAWMVAGLLVTLGAWIGDRFAVKRLAAATVGTLATFIVIRFCVFTTEAIQDRLDWFEAYRVYASDYERAHPDARHAREIRAPYPEHPNVRVESIEALLRWILQSPDLIVTVQPKPGGRQ
jgi:hypothetical protein